MRTPGAHRKYLIRSRLRRGKGWSGWVTEAMRSSQEEAEEVAGRIRRALGLDVAVFYAGRRMEAR